jgi:putative FmdB family regulatory protein
MALALSQVDCQTDAGHRLRGIPRLPTYEYHCDSCDKNFDVVQSFHDDALTECPTCGSPVRKVFGNVGIVFKGSGFYKTDSRTKTTAKPASGESSSPSEVSSSDTSSSDGSGLTSDGKKSADTSNGSTATSPTPKEKSSTPSSPTKSSSGDGKTSKPKK